MTVLGCRHKDRFMDSGIRWVAASLVWRRHPKRDNLRQTMDQILATDEGGLAVKMKMFLRIAVVAGLAAFDTGQLSAQMLTNSASGKLVDER